MLSFERAEAHKVQKKRKRNEGWAAALGCFCRVVCKCRGFISRYGSKGSSVAPSSLPPAPFPTIYLCSCISHLGTRMRMNFEMCSNVESNWNVGPNWNILYISNGSLRYGNATDMHQRGGVGRVQTIRGYNPLSKRHRVCWDEQT